MHIGKCLGVCAGIVDAKSYKRVIRHLILFFEGKKAVLIRQMEKEMKAAAQNLEFEKAALLRDQLFELRQALVEQDSSVPEWERARLLAKVG